MGSAADWGVLKLGEYCRLGSNTAVEVLQIGEYYRLGGGVGGVP